MENESGFNPIHTESAYMRAARECRAFVTNTVRFVVWIAARNITVVGVTTLLSWGHSRNEQVAIEMGALIAGTILAFLLPLGALWATAPIRQRNEARTEIVRLATPPGFPDVPINVPDVTQTRRHDGEGIDLSLPVFATNRTDEQVVLEFNLALQMPSGVPTRLKPFCDPEVSMELHPALTIPPRSDGHATLFFPVWEANLAEIHELAQGYPKRVPPHLLSLLIRERLSETATSIRVPTSSSW